MSKIAFRVSHLGKQYQLGQQNQYSTFRDLLMSTFNPFSTKNSVEKGSFWALDDLSFEIAQGESVGIIGRNGAGKSTLLKILSRITEPTRGRVEGYGRVGSLLEVGTGFHPELTGRENIFLNGAILGMKRNEITRKFDEIVAFAEIEKFLDTPVKHYSSGMYMRLAFAVAAHLEPEILIVDEVLAVGDAEFQKKCLGKMSEVAQQERTVLFVSHNLTAIQSLCSRALWLDKGRIVKDDNPDEVIFSYLQTSFSSLTSQVWEDPQTAPGNDEFRLHRADVHVLGGDSNRPITVRTPFVIEFEYWNLKPNAYLNINFHVYNEQGVIVFEAGPIHEPIWRPLAVGLHRDVCQIPGNLLNDGMYHVVMQAVTNQGTKIYQANDVLVFDVQDTNDLREGWFGKWGGVVRPVLEWDRKVIKQGLHG